MRAHVHYFVVREVNAGEIELLQLMCMYARKLRGVRMARLPCLAACCVRAHEFRATRWMQCCVAMLFMGLSSACAGVRANTQEKHVS